MSLVGSSFLFIIFMILDGVYLPIFMATYRSSISFNFSSPSMISMFLLERKLFIDISSFRNSFSSNSLPFSIFSSFSNLL